MDYGVNMAQIIVENVVKRLKLIENVEVRKLSKNKVITELFDKTKRNQIWVAPMAGGND